MKKASKKPYRKPSLEKVQLMAEESVLLTCKTGGSTGPMASQNCRQCRNQAPS